jgi:hypothetical protein
VAAIAVILAIQRHRPPSRRIAVPVVIAAGGATLLAVVAAVAYGARGLATDHVRGLVSYVWQFYLPKLPFMAPSIRSDWTVRDAFVDRFWTFAQFDVSFSRGVLDALAILSAIVIACALAALVVRRTAIRRAPDIPLVIVATVVIYIASAHLAAYRGLVKDPTDPVLTGRYLVPLIPLYGVVVALAVSVVPRRAAPAVGAVVLSGLALLQIGALGSVVERFYA